MYSPDPKHLLNLISSAYPGLVSYIDHEFKYHFVNTRYQEWFGIDPKDALGKMVPEIMNQEHFDQRKSLMERALKGEIVRFEATFNHVTLGLRDIEQIYNPDYREDGSIRGFVALANDITERKQAERALKENEARFRSLTEVMPQLVWVADGEGNVLWFNENWPRVTGTTLKENLGSGWLNVIHPDDRLATNRNWHETVEADHGGTAAEYRLRMVDGSYRWHVSRAIPIKDENEKVVRWVGTTTDIEEQVEALKKAEEKEKKLEEALIARDEFLSIASHELKTPLTSLKLQAQLTLRALELNKDISKERQFALANQTSDLVGRLTRLIDDMLDVSRIRTGKLNLDLYEHELSDIVREVVFRMSVLFETAGLKIPSIDAEPVKGEWDRFRMEQVIGNLLTNALRYGQGKPIQIIIRKTENAAQLIVKDQGHGIAPKDLTRIFGRFERAINSSEVSGLGLGLYISKEIVESHHGKIWVQSEVGKGSTFFVELPLKAQE